MFDSLTDERRLLMEVDLVPVQGQRFQPTGFPDLGAATYQTADGTRMLLVESAQSVANRLEAMILTSEHRLFDRFKDLSHIQVTLTGAVDSTTSSLVEAHRINSPYIINDAKFQAAFKKDAGYAKGQPIFWPRIAKALLKYDVNSLIHGCFLSNLDDGRVRLARALTGFIEARGVREVVSGGVKNNTLDPKGSFRTEQQQKDVYGNVPYQRVEYTAEGITAYFNLDLGLLSSYHLGEEAFELLVALALIKIQRFLDEGLRLRTACDLCVYGDLRVTEPEDFEVPELGDLIAYATRLSKKLSKQKEMVVTTLVSTVTEKESKKASEDDA